MLRWITAHSEYQDFFQSDRLLRSRHFFVPVLETSNDEIAIGITISKRIGKAVVRNLVKRRIKAFIRQYSDTLPSGNKINFIAKPGCGELSWQSMCDELKHVLLQLSLS